MFIKPSYLTLCLTAALLSNTLFADEIDKNNKTKNADEHIEVWAQKPSVLFQLVMKQVLS